MCTISPAEVKSYVQKFNVECNSVAIDLNPSMKPEVDTRFHQIFLKNGCRVHTAQTNPTTDISKDERKQLLGPLKGADIHFAWSEIQLCIHHPGELLSLKVLLTNQETVT